MDSTSGDEYIHSNRLLLIEYKYIFITASVLIAILSAFTVLTMVYCCLKRRNSFKSTNDLHSTHKLQEICIIPINKPSLNESKPQLNLDGKIIKSKTLIERRGSNNSLTITIDTNTNKKKLICALSTGTNSAPSSTTTSPPLECPPNDECLASYTNLLQLYDLIKISKERQNLFNEFFKIPTNHPERIEVYGSAIKNRYKEVLPNESTRVKLPLRNKDPLSVYINANYLNGYNNESKEFIATQGPMSNTLNDFWFMIWNESIQFIVMLTKLIESTKSKCELYIPMNCDECIYYGDICVTVNSITLKADYEIRQLNIRCNNETRVVYHYWYKTWPDQNVPSNADALIELIKHIDINRKQCDDNSMIINNNQIVKPKSPILVHCSAGIGRTGCFIALSIGIQQIDKENMVDVLKIVSSMRQQRGGMIQTIEQYEFIYQALANYSFNSLCYPMSPKLSPSACFKSFTFDKQTIE